MLSKQLMRNGCLKQKEKRHLNPRLCRVQLIDSQELIFLLGGRFRIVVAIMSAAAIPPFARTVDPPASRGVLVIKVTGLGASSNAQTNPASPEPTMITSSSLANPGITVFSIHRSTTFARPQCGQVLRQPDRFRHVVQVFPVPGRYSPALCASCADTGCKAG